MKSITRDFQIIAEIIRYGIVGGAAFVLDFLLLYILTERLYIPYLYSATIAFSSGCLVNYLLSVCWVFNHRKYTNKRVEFLIFFAVGVGGIIITDLMLFFFTPVFNGNYLAAKIIAVIFVFFWNFFLRRQLLFMDITN